MPSSLAIPPVAAKAEQAALLSSGEVGRMVGFKPRTIVNMSAEGRFPAPVIDTYRNKRWNRRHVERFIDTGRVR